MSALDLKHVHPVCAMFPMMSTTSEAFQQLERSIDIHGQIDPIVVDDQGQVLDGRNRLKACQRLGRDPRVMQFSEVGFGGDESEYAFVKNLGRRDLTDDQRSSIVVQFEAFYADEQAQKARRAEAAKAQPRGPNGKGFAESEHVLNSTRAGRAHEKVQAKAEVSQYKARQALDVAQHAPELLTSVANGETSLREAAKTANARKSAKPRAPKPFDIERAIDKFVLSIRKLYDVCPKSQQAEFRKRLLELILDL